MIGSLEEMLVSTTNWYLPSASAETEPCAGAAADLRQLRVESGALCDPGTLLEWSLDG